MFQASNLDVPDGPASVTASSISDDSITVEWSPPSNDGGATITGYVIEKKEAGRRAFHKVAQVKTF